MNWGARWSPEALQELRKKGIVREHRLESEEDKVKTGPKPKKFRIPEIPVFTDPTPRSPLEATLFLQMKAQGLPQPEVQHRPLKGRRFLMDFAWPDRKIGIEVQGMVHRIKDKFKRDIEKRAELMLAGWKVLEVDGDSIRSGRALDWAKRMLA